MRQSLLSGAEETDMATVLRPKSVMRGDGVRPKSFAYAGSLQPGMSSEDVAFDADDSARPVARRVESVRTSLKPSASFRAPSVKVSDGAGGRARAKSINAVTEDQVQALSTASGHADAGQFHFSHEGLTEEQAAENIRRYGPNQLPEKVTPKWLIFLNLLKEPMPMLIWAAIIAEASIEAFPDMSILLFIQLANASIGFYEITKAGDAVAKLKESLQARATVCRNGKFKEISAVGLVPGDLILLAAGSCVPADCRVNPIGKPNVSLVDVDESAMNGESLPKGKREGDSALMGTMVVRGETHATVEFTGANTELGTTAALLKSDEEPSNMQKLLVSIVTVLAVMSIAACVILFIYLKIGKSQTLKETISFTVVVLVASIPMAVEIVTNTTLALGSAELNKEGAIVSRLASIEDLASMSILCSDKTGTLTTNHMEIQDDVKIYTPGETRHSLLRQCAMAAKWNDPPRDALDTMVLEAVDMPTMAGVVQTDYMPFDPVQKRTEGTIKLDPKRPELKNFKVSKGAPKVILELCQKQLADPAFRTQYKQDNDVWGAAGIRSMAVARTNQNGEWEMLGMLSFMDPPRHDAADTIVRAREFGVAVKMITGDNYLIAKEMTRQLRLGDMVRAADGLPVLNEKKEKPANLSRDYGDMVLGTDTFSQVFPEHKYLIVECLRELGYKTGMTGDGVNDAPALKRADVGVAVKGATEAAQSAAAIVLTQPGLSTIISGIITARCIFVRIRNFLIYRIAATLQLLFFFFIAVFMFEPRNWVSEDQLKIEPGLTAAERGEWPEFFHMPVLMLMLITLLNDGTLIAIGYDTAIPQQLPEKWNKPALFAVSSILAFVALLSSLILLWLMLDSWTPGSVFYNVGLQNISYGQITTAIYLKISVSDFLTLFSSRTGNTWFWKSAPAPILVGAGSIALFISTSLSILWPESSPDGILTTGLGVRSPYSLCIIVWLYCIVWWFVQDAAKVAFCTMMVQNNWFGYNDTGKLVLPESTLAWKRANADAPEPSGHH